jgi:lysophospholipase L1-like esterase
MKEKKVIACLGDSMTEFWGPELRELRDILYQAFPGLEFELHNYGVSGTRAEYGKHRITNDYPDPFGEGAKKCLAAISPDIVLVESFAYNHRLDGIHQVYNYQKTLGQLVQTIYETTPAQILFWVTIPPDKNNFLDNIATYKDVSLELRREWAVFSDNYLNAALDFAKKEEIPLANVYGRVQQEVNKGTPIKWFIDQNDNIHPSRYAYRITAQEIVKGLKNYSLLT